MRSRVVDNAANEDDHVKTYNKDKNASMST